MPVSALSAAGIIQNFGSVYAQRGSSYQKEKRVEITSLLEKPGGHIIISARVTGSQSKPYRVVLTLVSQSEELWLDGNCSCPVGGDCKHCAAVAYEYLRNGLEPQVPTLKSVGKTAVERWLETLLQAGPTVPSAPPTMDAQINLIYVLSLDLDRLLQVKIMRTQQLRNGTWGKARPQDLLSLTSSTPPMGVSENDQEIARLLRAESFGRFGSYQGSGSQPPIPLNSGLGLLALEKILATERCHWEDCEGREVKAGTTRTLDVTWQSTPRGERLKIATEPSCTEILTLPELLYWDQASGQIGPIESTLEKHLIPLLLKAPEIPRTILESLVPRLSERLPQLQLPLPTGLEIEQREIQGIKPQIHLTLSTAEQADLSDETMHLARLEFSYDGARLSTPVMREVQIVFQGRSRLRIYRDLETEQAAIELLTKELGLAALPWKDPRTSEPPLRFGFLQGPLMEQIMAWDHFLHEDLAKLEAAGWEIHKETGFLRIEEAKDWYGEVETQSENGWFELSLGIEVQGEQINLLPILVSLLRQAESPQQMREVVSEQPSVLLPLGESRWLRVPSIRLLAILDTLIELYDKEPLNAEGKMELSQNEGLQLHLLLNDPELKWQGAGRLPELSRNLQMFKGITETPAPKGLKTQLRPYQQEGLNWLQFLNQFGFGGVLADDMGLGKTIQALAHILVEKEAGRLLTPVLVVVPASLLFNWQREAARFAPELKCLVLHGTQRNPDPNEIQAHDMVITTYALVRQDLARHRRVQYHIILLDEAQNIKNPSSKTAQALFQLQANQRLALTGTPMENHLAELWSIYRFAMPGFLGPLDRFTRLFRTPIEKLGDNPRRLQLQERIRPFLLRRTKQAVLDDLPEKTEIIRFIALEGKQRDLYETLRIAMDTRVREEVQKMGVKRSQIMILDALLKLRQVCCDPRLLAMQEAQSLQKSAKLQALMEMIPEILSEGGRILVFSQFVSMLRLIEAELGKLGIAYALLTGETRQREREVDRFQNGEVPIFLISLKAGGVGLNLTAADTVIHYDPWWNPAVENQATDRAWRIGQDKQVFVYKLIAEKTVEEKILALQAKKRALVAGIYAETSEGGHGISSDELLALLSDD
jgi:superfamily II DNA or RNA helicase